MNRFFTKELPLRRHRLRRSARPEDAAGAYLQPAGASPSILGAFFLSVPNVAAPKQIFMPLVRRQLLLVVILFSGGPMPMSSLTILNALVSRKM